MKINDSQFADKKAQSIIELRDLLAQPSDKQARPCPDCRVRFGQESTLSAENCSFACRYAPRHMSGQPDKYPIEGGIVPLVYALYSLRLVKPCWSCEGHLGPDKNIHKQPKVWFYSHSEIYPKLIAQTISDLQGKGKIDMCWGVKVLPFSQSLFQTTYSIEPVMSVQDLPKLRSDIIIMGQTLRRELLQLSQGYVKRGVKVSR